jgi:uncharacterized glyoxalase superfamily protein PhnB
MHPDSVGEGGHRGSVFYNTSPTESGTMTGIAEQYCRCFGSGRIKMTNTNAGSILIPGMRYRNAPAAIEWLCKAFGFERKLVVPGPDNTVAHAELTFGNGMVMLGSAKKEDSGRPIKQAELRGMEASIYMVVSDVDGHYKRSKAAGAKIAAEPEEKGHGGKGYACWDLEGNVWHFGSYNPWTES